MQITQDTLQEAQHMYVIASASADDILVRVTAREEIDWSCHVHDKFQIIYILSGTLHIEVEGISHFVTDRHLIWIPEGISHRLSSNNRQISLLVAYFHLDNVRNHSFAVFQTDELVARNLRFISKQTSINRYETPELFTFSSGFFGMLPLMCRKATFPVAPFILIKDSRLTPVLEYIKENINQDLSIESVAFHFGFSVRNLTRLFTESGIRFVHYLNYQRVVRAVEILADNTMNVEQTAYEVGFNSPGSFSRVFKQITGESPQQYVRNHVGKTV